LVFLQNETEANQSSSKLRFALENRLEDFLGLGMILGRLVVYKSSGESTAQSVSRSGLISKVLLLSRIGFPPLERQIGLFGFGTSELQALPRTFDGALIFFKRKVVVTEETVRKW
jgi:hypothetical protein